MECQDSGLSIGSSGLLQLDTIRALHQTVVSLRSALERSKSEISQLREKYQSHQDCSLYEDTIQKLTLENHSLRQKIIDSDDLQIEISKASDTVNIGLLSDYDLLKTSTSFDVSHTDDGYKLKELKVPQIVIEEGNVFEDNIVITSSPLNADYANSDDKIKVQVETDHVDKNVIELINRTDKFSASYDENKSFCGAIETEESSTTDNGNEGEYQVNIDEDIFHDITVDSSLSGVDDANGKKEAEALILSTTEDIGSRTFHSKKKNDYQTKIELESKFDVTIRVCASKNGPNIFSSTSSNTDSMESGKRHEEKPRKENFSEKEVPQPGSESKYTNQESSSKDHVISNQGKNKVIVNTLSSDTVAMAVPNNSEDSVHRVKDKFNIQVRITSEENPSVNTKEIPKHLDSLNLDLNDLSLRSEGEKSVCSEDIPTSVEVDSQAESDYKEGKICEQDDISNDSEEVDDIELIFTTDESKDVTGLQEDLVSITDADHNWSDFGPNATPVLLKFNALDPEKHDDSASVTETTENVESENQENISMQSVYAETNVQSESNLKRSVQSLGQDAATNTIRSGILKHVHSDIQFDHKYLDQKSVDDSEFYTHDYSRALSFENNTKSSSFDRSSTLDYTSREFSLEHRDESIDQFDMKDYPMSGGVRYTLFPETDISKCGISEEDITKANLNSRRNTCPNPFQYRPIPHRSALRGTTRAPYVGYKAAGRARPVLYSDSLAMRREKAAQTEVSALPDRWSSDGYLAHKAGLSALTTLPGRMSRPLSRPVYEVTSAATRSRLAPHAHTDEARRSMLSDIGFTSMVPELSRSADPLWCVGCAPSVSTGVSPAPCLRCGRRDSVPTSPMRYPDSLAKYLTGESSQSGPSASSNNRRWTDSWHLSRTYSKKANLDKRSSWRNSLPELRPVATDSGDSTEELLDEAERFLRRSIDNLHDRDSKDIDEEQWQAAGTSRPYLPAEPRHLRLGHMVKVITPHGRIAVGKVRYVGLAGGAMQVGVAVCAGTAGLPENDGTLQGRRYFRTDAAYTALFVPFAKVVMAWPA